MMIANRDLFLGTIPDGPLAYGVPIISSAVVVHIYFLAFGVIPRLRDANIPSWLSSIFLVPILGWLIALCAAFAPTAFLYRGRSGGSVRR